jgi:hypothetical protein
MYRLSTYSLESKGEKEMGIYICTKFFIKVQATSNVALLI